MAPWLADAERVKICKLSEEDEIDPYDIAIAPGIDRSVQTVERVLVGAGLLPPSRPDLGEAKMQAIAADYESGKTIRALTKPYGRSFGGIRDVLVYKRVPLRGRGGPRPRKRP